MHKVFDDLCGEMCDPSTGCGGAMPLAGTPSDADRGTIVAWIAAGAPR